MEFCEKCGSLMLPSEIDGKKVFKCRCGAIKPFSEEKSLSYKVKTKINHSVRNEVVNATEIMEWKEANLK
ncbi:MAG: hypothetical protein EU539_11450, partial [Promethearchaeota archaeon]